MWSVVLQLLLFGWKNDVDLMCALYIIGLDVIPSHWTRRGLRARSAWGSWFFWRPPNLEPRRHLPTLSKRTTVRFDRSWQVKPTRMWCVNSARTLPPRRNSREASQIRLSETKNGRFRCSVSVWHTSVLSHFSQCFLIEPNLVFYLLNPIWFIFHRII